MRELRGDIFVGVDVGRRKDLTVISVLEKVGTVLFLRKIEILKKLPFSKQFEILDHITAYARRVAIDETGIGMQLAEELLSKWGELKVIPVYFSGKVKEEIATKLKSKFEDRLIQIPADKNLREDLHSVERTVTPAGNIKLEAKRSETGHADRFWSLALAVHASSLEEEKIVAPPVFISGNLKENRRSRWEYWRKSNSYLA